jgi:hypothetical protein
MGLDFIDASSAFPSNDALGQRAVPTPQLLGTIEQFREPETPGDYITLKILQSTS